jgi:SAM-dependent methyltransferase
MTEKPYYARYDDRYRKVRELGLDAFKKDDTYVTIDIELLDRFLASREAIAHARRVIEFGCGDGFLACHLAKRGYDVTAFDYSQAAIDGCLALARRQGVNVDFRQGDALAIDWAQDASFDLGVSNFVLQMFGTNADRARCVSEMHRVLKPDAYLYLRFPTGTEQPESIESIEELRKHREFFCDLKAKVTVDGKEIPVTWPEVASWGLNVYSAPEYMRDRGFRLEYIQWDAGLGYAGLVMYLRKEQAEPSVPGGA